MIKDTIFRYYYENLNPKEKAIYERLYDGLSAFCQRIDLPGCRPMMLERLFCSVLYDNPRFFYVANAYNWVGGMVLQFLPSYRYSQAEVAALRRDISQKSARTVSHITGRTPFFAEKYIHDMIVANTHYDMQFSDESQYMTGVLLQGKAVCSGIAQCIKFFMDQIGLPCIYVVGEGKNGARGSYEPHAWNAVHLNGVWYHVDATYDMTLTEQAGTMRYDYLNLSLQEIERDHKIAQGRVGDSRSAGYYRLANAQITYPAQIGLHIQRAVSCGERHCVVQLLDQTSNAVDRILLQAEKHLDRGARIRIYSNDSQRVYTICWE